MTLDELLDLLAPRHPRVIRGQDLKDRTPRTLVYGYTVVRTTFHVYLDEAGKIRVVEYDHNGHQLHHATEDDITDNWSYVPNKRVYPEACDYAFCLQLMDAGVKPPFGTHDATRPLQRFYGKRVEELTSAAATASAANG